MYYDLKIFSTAVLTLNFDLDLSKVNLLLLCRTSVPNFVKIVLAVLF